MSSVRSVVLTARDSSKIMVHVRTLSSQTIHPLAARSPLISPAPSSETLQQLPVGSCFVQIVDDVIGMFFWHSGSSLRVWNWRTGAVLVVCTSYSLSLGNKILRYDRLRMKQSFHKGHGIFLSLAREHT